MIDTEMPKNWDEVAYLETHKDVYQAVLAGIFKSGWQHFLMHGNSEKRLSNFSSEQTRKKITHKSGIIHQLAKAHNYQHYLELRTSLTGPDCMVSPSLFESYTCIKYKIPESGKGVDREGCLDGKNFDIALIDPWHTYDASLKDLIEIFSNLKNGGVIVCHDAWPPNKKITELYEGAENCPCLHNAEWSGVTFVAYMDFVLEYQTKLQYFTVPQDYGCGVIFKKSNEPNYSDEHETLINAWMQIHNDYSAAYDFLANKGQILLQIKEIYNDYAQN